MLIALMLVSAGNSNLNLQYVKNWQFFINLVIGVFVHMYQHKIQSYDKISQLGSQC